jgi:4-alpha-glucanotransferase
MAEYRASGILLHVTSLPGSYGIGDFGREAYGFADFLAETEQRLWQLLPLVPVGHGYSPYSSPSTFAINPLLISPDLLFDARLVTREELDAYPSMPGSHVDFELVIRHKTVLLEAAHARFRSEGRREMHDAFVGFCRREASWLDDYALFMAIRSREEERVWTAWPKELRDRDPDALLEANKELASELDMHRFWQFLAADQWARLREYCNGRGIRIIGDIPIYVAHDSADVWANPDLFQLDEVGNPTVVAGVQPDYFSKTGQRWGNPIYRWDVMERRGYDWWTRRIRSTLHQVDIVRLDHFRGFEAYWEVAASEPTAVKGRWVDGPGAKLFDALRHNLGSMPIIAEDLGVITQGVVDLMQRYGFPGMAVFQFAFDSDFDDKFLPHNYHRNLIAYTGTHDNDTVHGWYASDLSTQDARQVHRARSYCREYLQLQEPDEPELHWHFVRALSMSVANHVVYPLQDVLGLGTDARMNVPGEARGDWTWRYDPDQLTTAVRKRLRDLTVLYGRGTPKAEENSTTE